MTRSIDIQEKLTFALIQIQSLGKEIHAARDFNKDITFLGQKVGQILSSCRECYCAKDLSELFLPTTKNIYFPFSNKTFNDGHFNKLKDSHPFLHLHLKKLIKKIDDNTPIESTLFGHRVIRETNDLVNAKKHDKITQSRRKENSLTRAVDFRTGHIVTVSPTYRFFSTELPDFSSEGTAPDLEISSGEVDVQKIPEFRLIENNWEVVRFCWHTLEISWRVLDEIYSTFVGDPVGNLNTYETIKPPEQRKFESEMRLAAPVVTRLIGATLINRGLIIRKVGIHFDGRYTSSDPDDLAIAMEFLDVFDIYLWHTVCRQHLANAILKTVGEKLDTLWEANLFLPHPYAMTLPSGQIISFDKVIIIMGTKFCCHDPDRTRTPRDDAYKRATAMFKLPPPQFVTLPNSLHFDDMRSSVFSMDAVDIVNIINPLLVGTSTESFKQSLAIVETANPGPKMLPFKVSLDALIEKTGENNVRQALDGKTFAEACAYLQAQN